MINPWDHPEQWRRIKDAEQRLKDEKPFKRKSISKRLRSEVFDKKGRNCTYCDAEPVFGLDHVVPVSRGGGNTFENLVPCCDRCNSRKCARDEGVMRHA